MKLFAERVAAIVIVLVILGLVAWCAAEISSLSDRTIAGIFTYSGFGLCVLAWRWPRTFTGPLRRLIGKA